MLCYYLKVNGRLYGGTFRTLAEAREARSEVIKTQPGAVVETRGIRR